MSSPFDAGRTKDILDVIDCYARDYANLKTHSDRYPAPAALRAITKQGEKEVAPYAGVRRSTEGSEWIVKCARRADPRPLHVLVWGGIEDLAQALRDAPDILPKLRVYYIGGPNKKWGPHAYRYIAMHHSTLWIIEANATYRGWFAGGNQQGEWGIKGFVTRHVKGHGALGDFFVGKQDDLKMGDTLWLPYGARGLAEHRVLPALLGTLGCLGLGALGLRRAYRGTVKFYQGETGGKAAARITRPITATAGATTRVGKNLLELRLPLVPEPAAAVALGTFRSMLRAPEAKMAWGTAFIVTVVLGGSLLFRAAPKIPEAAGPFIVTGAMVFSLFMLVQFLSNQFGFDRQGFRAFVLSPADRRLIVLGKNLATWPVGGGFGLLLLGAIGFWLKLSVTAALAAVFQLTTLLLLGSLGGNLLSILVPFRIEPGSMKPTKMPALAMVVMVVSQLLFPVVMLPVFVPPLLAWLWDRAGWPAFVPVNLLLSILLAALAALVYWQSLGPLGRLLQRREIRILNTVTAEQE